MDLYNINELPFSSNPEIRRIQEKIIKNEELSFKEKINAGRDHPVHELGGYNFNPDHAYRAISKEMLAIYIKSGFIIGAGENDEYEEYEQDGKIYNNNRGVDWYLGGIDIKYGDIVIECPAYKEYFTLAFDNGNGMSYDPTIKFIKSSGTNNPIPISMITKIFDVSKIKERRRLEKTVDSIETIRELNISDMIYKDNTTGGMKV